IIFCIVRFILPSSFSVRMLSPPSKRILCPEDSSAEQTDMSEKRPIQIITQIFLIIIIIDYKMRRGIMVIVHCTTS
ncbi:MAG TPA: hypothetical protein PLY78_06820, partial [Methanospirillum sp.]|nr:hypothetical protein [Methanospirillum sp.]